MKVSVCIITYNHEAYIAQAIEGALMQQTDFPYEIIIGEDDSSDNTRFIVKGYGERYPDKIRLLLNDRSNVIYINGRPTGRWNFINTLKYAGGQYIALCEGDDYWTDPYKLQKQVDYMEQHPECVICFHQTEIITDDKNVEPRNYALDTQKEVSFLDDLLVRNFIPTGSVLFRNGLIREFPEWYYRLPFADWPFWVLLAQYGYIGYINHTMGVYRMHQGGMWSSQEYVKQNETAIQALDIFDTHFKYKYRRLIKSIKLEYYYRIINYYQLHGSPKKERKFAVKALLSYPTASISWKRVILSFFPHLLCIKNNTRKFFSGLRKRV